MVWLDVKKRIAIVHWFPVERFPPAFNLVRTLESIGSFRILLATTSDRRRQMAFSSDVAVRRTPFPTGTTGRILRLLRYIQFPLLVFVRLVRFRPDCILYYEPHSALPVCMYVLFFPRCRIFAHYHEYHSPEEFLCRGMRFARVCHWAEKQFLYRRLEWLSQTNEARLQLFLRDHPGFRVRICHELPNFPPSSWGEQDHVQRLKPRIPLRLVYVGALSVVDTFIAEVARWISVVPEGMVLLDIYTTNIDREARSVLSQLRSERIRVFDEGVAYDDLPALLREYDVGLILYRGNTLNYIHNAPNKLFEYLACGLDVWFPRQMDGVKRFARTNECPRVIEVDFERLLELGPSLVGGEETLGRCYVPFVERCESVYQELADRFMVS